MKTYIYPCFALLLIIFSIKIVAQPGAGKTLDFNGTSTYLDCGPVNLSGSQITMQAWVNVDAFKTNFPYITSIIGTETPGSSHAFLRLGDASFPNDKIQFVLFNGTTDYKLQGVTSLSTNKWYHIAATYDGTTMKLYINGVLDASLSNSTPIVSNDDFFIGRNYGNDRIMDGEIDEVSTWSTALSQATIRDWMCKKITPAHPNYANLTGYWPLNEGSGTTTEDMSANSANGTFVGNPTWGNSGAPIGDVSKHTYAGTYSLGLSHPQGDSIHFTHTSGSVQAAHIYRIDSVPYVTSAPFPLQFLDTSHYWGIFVVGSSSYTTTYFYNGNLVVSGNSDCNLGFSNRANGASNAWSYFNLDSINFSTQAANWHSSGTKEFALGISSNGPHSFSFSEVEPSCKGDADGELTLTVSGGTSPYSYQWASGSITQTATGLSTGYHTVTITDANTCVSSDSFFLTEPDIISSFTNVTQASCEFVNDGAAVVNAIGGTGGFAYIWNDPNGTTTNTLNDIYPGTYLVTITDMNGCTAVDSVEVSSTGSEPGLELGADTIGCEGTPIQLLSSVQNGPISTYVWSTGQTTPAISVNAAGTYYLTVTHASGCPGIDSISVSFIDPIQVNLGPNITSTGNHEINAGGGFQSYLWNSGATSQKINVNSSGTYTVSVTDENGCKSADTIKVTIIPAGIQGNSGIPDLNIWPNPADHLLFIESSTGIKSISLYDITGRIILESNYSQENNIQLELEGLEPGKYFIRISSQEEVFTKPFVKR